MSIRWSRSVSWEHAEPWSRFSPRGATVRTSLIGFHDGVGEHELEPGDTLHKVLHVIVGRLGDDVFRRADLDNAAILHDGDPVADADRFVQVVGDEDGGFVQLGRQVAMNWSCSCRRMSGSSAEKGSSIKQDFRVGSQCAGKADTLLHAAGEFAGEPVFVTVQIDQSSGSAGRPPSV